MSRWSLGLVALLFLTSLGAVGSAHAAELELSLSRLSQGECASTEGEWPLVLRSQGAQTLQPDALAFRQLVSQVGLGVAPMVMAPVTTSGPVGFDVGLETTASALDRRADYLARGTRGRGAQTCSGRNDALPPALVTNRLHFEKGLPYGLSVGALVGRVQAAQSFLFGVDAKVALLEDVWRSRVPDLALRVALQQLVGARALSLYVASFDALVSERFVVQQALEVSPWVGAGLLWTRARTSTVDLTPNIDALSCRDGGDTVCNAKGLGASADDLGHDVRFARVSQLRLRSYVGLWLRYRQVALSSSLSLDPLPPRVGDHARGRTISRQWTVNVAPTVTF